MKPIFVLVHGWGFDAAFWSPLQAALPPDSTLTWDLGFFGAPAQPAPPPGRPIIAAGHSFGLLWLLHHRPFAWQALAAINGFTCFTARDSFPAGIAPRLLTRMTTRLGQSPAPVVAGFRKTCGSAAPPPATPDAPCLQTGLHALATWDERPAPVDLALCGRSDPLVSAAMSEACFPNITWHEGGHLLPQQAPAWCATQLLRLA
jgi:pimeloyl-[acyl-carrier protein] methyl ester esterase